MSKVHIQFEGYFSSREEAVEALRDAIGDVASGKWTASAQPANYALFITSADDGSTAEYDWGKPVGGEAS